jgi:hypothetical protein
MDKKILWKSLLGFLSIGATGLGVKKKASARYRPHNRELKS